MSHPRVLRKHPPVSQTCAMATNTAWVVPAFNEADRLRKARELTGLNRAQFAEVVGVSEKTVLNYERGATSRIKPLVRRAWALATGVPAVWLETGEAPGPDGPDEGLLVRTVRRQGLEPRTQWLRAARVLGVAA